MPQGKLLIVDDDAVFCKRLARAMQVAGFEVNTAESLAAEKSAIQQDPPAYAVLDLKLEDGSGLDITAWLHAAQPNCRIVMLTGFGDQLEGEGRVPADVSLVLNKPVQIAGIHDALRRVVAKT